MPYKSSFCYETIHKAGLIAGFPAHEDEGALMIFNLENRQHLSQRLSQYLKNFRLKNSLTQAQLAKKIGVTKSTVCRFEKIDQSPLINSLELLQSLASLEGRSLDAFIDFLLEAQNECDASPASEFSKFQDSSILSRLCIDSNRADQILDLCHETIGLSSEEIEHLAITAKMLKSKRA